MDKLRKILVTGGSGFIGGTLIRNLLANTDSEILNIDYLNYASDKNLLNYLETKYKKFKHHKIDLANESDTLSLLEYFKPDIIFHLAAESHVDRSINNPKIFLNSNVLGTFSLLEASRKYWNSLSLDKKKIFRILHISTDEVFGSVVGNKKFDEMSRYDPRSPYSASKASSDHFVKSWNHTYGLPTIITNCTNNFGPYQYPEKLIPLTIFNALRKKNIQIYGDGKNIRDWLFVDDHIEALLCVAERGTIGESYCIGGSNEKNNIEIVNKICEILDSLKPIEIKYNSLIKFISDRPGHDRRYAIDSTKIKEELGWEPKLSFEIRIEQTVKWYLENQNWCSEIIENG